ncbi:MAG: hypothetical protein A2937_01595 [Candidatus Yonathbacteria bacterium RIFCSPLOWO2_01_FULL_47_33b]|uniref:histidine kinase n=1 Tax=Candidatus Yonathbacteria bacterium RIFCSPLOWO2_01_FULL_47_33b TaxID=1802727 RepID=A0A1G2SI48_9BACT|nr:MAG: hypothetical protein A2937_01595 [Candidatus Yonathbacteria bacterium RIFCSPLOWO2_01_FULL_47_33b]
MGASLVHAKFDNVVDVGTSLASRARVYQNIEKGDWDGAMKSLEGTPPDFPYIDTVSFLDNKGILKAIISPNPEIIGKNFAYRDYYQGVSKDWRPYVSAAFTSVIAPKHNIITVSVPVKSLEQKVLGILVFAVNLDAVVRWSKDINIVAGGFIYVVDKNGILVAHPNLNVGGDLIDYSSDTTVQKILRGEHGVEVVQNSIENEEQVVAYAPVQDYGFGVAVVQQTRVAFAERNHQAVEFAIIWVLLILITSFSFYRILQSRTAVKAQRDRERTLLESIGDGVVAIDRDWRITLWNKAASTITGWSKEEALGQPLRAIIKFIRERDRKENIAFIEDTMVSGNPSSMEAGTLLIKKDGSEVVAGDSVSPLVGTSGNIEGAVIVFRDASKERESMHLRSDFAYASHQLRTPVTEAVWNLETAMTAQSPEKRQEFMWIAHHALMSVKALAEHLVKVSEIDQGDIMAQKATVKLVDLFTELEHDLEYKVNVCKVALVIEPMSHLIAVKTDPKLLKKALFEIIENAVIYSRENTEVKVVATLEEKDLLVKVTDVGVGITDEEQAIIFTKFFRGSNRPSGVPGSGLGLYIAKEYIKLLGGKIWFTSEEGKGTTFYVSVPVE